MTKSQDLIHQLSPYTAPMPNPREGDWLTENYESGETLTEYSGKAKPRFKLGELQVLVSMHGSIPSEIPDIVRGVIDCFYPGAISTIEAKSGGVDDALLHRRPSIGFGEQILAEGLMNQVKPQDGGFAHLAITSEDIYYNAGDPDDWGYGYSDWEEGSAVVATPRCGNPSWPLGAMRFMKLVLHEIGHLFYLPHCVLFRCLMNGVNNDSELDAIPLDLCPECLAKYVLLTGCSPKMRFIRLSEYWKSRSLNAEAARALALSKRISH